jgi:hypothetical protein
MLIEACDLVSSVLSGFRTDTPHEFAAKNSSRLPEKGDVDYIPYKNIDLVWNLVRIDYIRERIYGLISVSFDVLHNLLSFTQCFLRHLTTD